MIRAIETQLNPVGAKVEESVILLDTHDGTPREVDVLITIPAGDRSLRIGIEARDHKRRADLQWIEQLKTKFEFLDIDRRVAVSRKGFSKAALAKARLFGIETMTLSAATSKKWNPAINGIEEIVVGTGFVETTNVQLHLRQVEGRSPGSLPDAAQIVLHHPDGVIESVVDFLNRANRSQQLLELIQAAKPDPYMPALPISFAFPIRTFVDLAGDRWEITGLDTWYRHVERKVTVPLQRGMYGKHAVLHGTASLGGASVEATYIEEERGSVRGGITFTIGDSVIEVGTPDNRKG